jgi:putative endonuclease
MGADPSGSRDRRRIAAALGREGEDLAARYLERHGYRVVGPDFRGPGGQLDLICRRGQAVVLVEVKTRSSTRWGSPGEAITLRKQRALQAMAREYRALAEWKGPIEFAVVSVVLAGQEPQIELFERPF